ncbi:MAG: SulP family inorganic anion transporter, partial [Flavisolibacter sp.]|nr:SulP family inorganic anion transporter [Flavisolibacter sp.]
YKLAKPVLFKQVYRQGWEQFVPFVATIAGILFTDLLKGIAIGMAVAIFYILRSNFKNAFSHNKEGTAENEEHHVTLSEEVTFLNKGSIMKLLNNIPDNSKLVIEGSKSKAIHHDVVEILEDFHLNAKTKNIKIEIKGIKININNN